MVPHQVCITCGTYKSREVIALKRQESKAKQAEHAHEEKKA
jgi:hypothetical protein